MRLTIVLLIGLVIWLLIHYAAMKCRGDGRMFP